MVSDASLLALLVQKHRMSNVQGAVAVVSDADVVIWDVSGIKDGAWTCAVKARLPPHHPGTQFTRFTTRFTRFTTRFTRFTTRFTSAQKYRY